MKIKTKNPLVKPSLRQWFEEWWCSKFGHKTIGDFYGMPQSMPQSHCGNCGAINKYIASKGCPEWIVPDYLDA